MPRLQEIIRYCGSLVIVTVRQIKDADYGQEDDTDHGQGEATMEIQLAHFSVQTYLVSKQVEDIIVKDLPSTARRMITEICLTYLLELDILPTAMRFLPSRNSPQGTGPTRLAELTSVPTLLIDLSWSSLLRLLSFEYAISSMRLIYRGRVLTTSVKNAIRYTTHHSVD